MRFAIDLISDLHRETWPNFDWTGQATSPYCLVLGDVARDLEILRETLEHLASCYQGVFYIDGNDEHRYSLDDLGSSYRLVDEAVKGLDRVVYMQDQVVIINGVAVLATNGWWSYDLDPDLDFDQSVAWHRERMDILDASAHSVTGLAISDAKYLASSVRKLQTHADVKAIIIGTHTVPRWDLLNHDPDLIDTWRFNCMGNPHLLSALSEDTENKIRLWCFGHYHKPVDRVFGSIRYTNNCRGRGNTDWCQSVYYPKRIEIDI